MNTDRVKLSRELSAFVADRIAQYGTESDEKRSWLVPYVDKYKILPLLVDWTETIGIMPDGAIRKFSADGDFSEYEGLRTVDDAVHFLGALVQGTRRYPVLHALIPARPDDATTCGSCLGRELFPQYPDVVCECGGVGWKVPDDKSFSGDAAEAIVDSLMQSKRNRIFVRLVYAYTVSILIFTAFVLLDWTFEMGILPPPFFKFVAYAVAFLIAFLIAPKVARHIR
jgi:hypothetical protein